MGRRYTVATYLRRLAPLQDEFNLTSDVIVGFPAEDERAFANTLAHRARRRPDEDPRLPVLAAARHGHRAATIPVPPQEKKERGARLRAASHDACLARWRTKIGREDVVLVDRPGRGYGDDYSPWLVAARRAGRRARAACAARPSRRRGSSLPDDDCLFCTLYRDGDHVATTEGFVAIRDINPQARRRTCSSCPSGTSRASTRSAQFPPDEAKRMLDFIAEVAAREGLTDYRVVVNAGAGAGQTIFHLHWHILGGGPIGRMA